MRELTATFYGTESVKVQNGVVGVSEYLVLGKSQDLFHT